ncbi:MAG: hypothetical protein ACPGLY_20675 [Rubripirellula sp.]
MQYPLELRFKLLALGQRITATDANGQVVMFIKQKMFRLKEHVEVFSDTNQNQLVFTIRADRVIDFSANYSFVDANGNDWGAVRRKGMKSLWSAHYDVMQDGAIDMTMCEESAIKKVLESLLGQIPLLGVLATYLINPTYLITRPDGTPLLRLIKKPAFFEGCFELEKLSEMPEDDELRSLLAILMAVLLERRRG